MSRLAHSSDFMDQIERQAIGTPDGPEACQYPLAFLDAERVARDRLFAAIRHADNQRRTRWARQDQRIANALKEHQQ